MAWVGNQKECCRYSLEVCPWLGSNKHWPKQIFLRRKAKIYFHFSFLFPRETNKYMVVVCAHWKHLSGKLYFTQNYLSEFVVQLIGSISPRRFQWVSQQIVLCKKKMWLLQIFFFALSWEYNVLNNRTMHLLKHSASFSSCYTSGRRKEAHL